MKKEEQILRDELSNNAGHCNYSIKAGAGGGKTTLLSKRICRQIVEGTPLEEFVIITYTNAAAAELRDSIAKQLTKVILDKKASEKENENAKTALNSIELIQISTIHAFLLKILRENAFESGVTLDATMLEADEDTARQITFFNKWYNAHDDEISKYRDDWLIESKSSKVVTDRTYQVFRNMFLDIANVREEIQYDVSDHTKMYEKMAKGYVKKWLQSLKKFYKKFEANWPSTQKGEKTKRLNGRAKRMNENMPTLIAATQYGVEEAKIVAQILVDIKEWVEKDYESFYGYNGDSSALEGHEPKLSDWELEWNFAKLYDDYLSWADKSSKVVEYVCKIRKEYQKEIDSNTLSLSNDDILYRANKLFEEHPEIIDKLRSTYSKLYVDEFQDTTGLQANLVKMLAEKVGAKATDNDLEMDKLIVVGDPKQSIYRFTGAEKSVYDATDTMMEDLPNDVASSVSLDTNFRSNKAIVDWVNDKYSKLMPSDYSAMDTDWVVTENEALHGVYGHAYEKERNKDGSFKAYKKEVELESVVGLVQSLVNNPKCFIEEPNRKEDGTFDKPTLRRIRYSDIMIISRNTTRIKNYVESMSKQGVPVSVQGKFKIDMDEIVNNFVLLIDYFATYKNRKNRYIAEQIWSGFDATQVDKDELKKVNDELAELRERFRQCDNDPAVITRYLLTHEDLFLPKGRVQSPERVREYRIRLNQMVETCLANNDGDITSFAKCLKKYIEGDIKREIPLEQDENAIRIMNVHQAKGLTGQIVIIDDRFGVEECRYSGFKNQGKYYPSAYYKYLDEGTSYGKTMPAFGWDIERLRQAYDEEREEAIRLEYVAATRAAHALIIMPPEKEGVWFTNKVYDYDNLPTINAWLEKREADTSTYSLEEDELVTEKSSYNLKELETNLKNADTQNLSQQKLVSITPSGLEPSGTTGYNKGQKEYKYEDRPKGNVFGTVMHRVYELIFMRYEILLGLDVKKRNKAIEGIVNQAILESADDLRKNDNPEEFQKYLIDRMIEYFDNVITPIMNDAEEVYPEYTFSFYVDDDERDEFIKNFEEYYHSAKDKIDIIDGQTIWVNGQADLVVKCKDGSIKVYDYKSDARSGKPQADFDKCIDKKYEGQLALYRYAIGKSFGVSDVETELVDLYR